MTPSLLHRLLPACAAALLLLAAVPAQAEVFWDKASLLKSFFATSERVTFKRLTLTAEQLEAARKRLGYAPSRDLTVYYGMTRDQIDGVAIIDNELGQHEPITFGVHVGTDGSLRRLEVMVYREAYGDEVREARFRNQFKGKTARDPVRHGQDIVAIAGATISSKSLAAGSKRVLVLVDELLVRPGVAKVLAPAKLAASPAAAPRAH